MPEDVVTLFEADVKASHRSAPCWSACDALPMNGGTTNLSDAERAGLLKRPLTPLLGSSPLPCRSSGQPPRQRNLHPLGEAAHSGSLHGTDVHEDILSTSV